MPKLSEEIQEMDNKRHVDMEDMMQGMSVFMTPAVMERMMNKMEEMMEEKINEIAENKVEEEVMKNL